MRPERRKASRGGTERREHDHRQITEERKQGGSVMLCEIARRMIMPLGFLRRVGQKPPRKDTKASTDTTVRTEESMEYPTALEDDTQRKTSLVGVKRQSQRIPYDILLVVAEQMEGKTGLARLARVSKSLYACCTPLLYRHIELIPPSVDGELQRKRDSLLWTVQNVLSSTREAGRYIRSVDWKILHTMFSSPNIYPGSLLFRQSDDFFFEARQDHLATVKDQITLMGSVFRDLPHVTSLTITFVQDPFDGGSSHNLFGTTPNCYTLAEHLPWKKLRHFHITYNSLNPYTPSFGLHQCLNQLEDLEVLHLTSEKLEVFDTCLAVGFDGHVEKLVLESDEKLLQWGDVPRQGQVPLAGQDVITQCCRNGLRHLEIRMPLATNEVPMMGIDIREHLPLLSLKMTANMSDVSTYADHTWTACFTQLPNLKTLHLDFATPLAISPDHSRSVSNLLSNAYICPSVCPELESFVMSAPVMQMNIGTQCDLVSSKILQEMSQPRPSLSRIRIEYTLSPEYHEEASSLDLVQQILEKRMPELAMKSRGEMTISVKSMGVGQVVFVIRDGSWSSTVSANLSDEL